MNEIQIIPAPAEILDKIGALGAITKITTPEESELISDGINLIGKQIAKIEAQRVEMKAGVLETGRKIDNAAKDAKAPLESAKVKLDTLQKAWLLEQKRIADAENERVRLENEARIKEAADAEAARIAEIEAEAKLLAMMDGEDPEEAAVEAHEAAIAPTLFNPPPVELEVPVAVQTRTIGNYGSTGLRDNWTFEIVDEKLIPRDFLMVDESKIRAAVKAGKDATVITGVRVFNDPTIARRG